MGVGGAAVTPVTLAIITVVFPPAERGRAIGVWAAAVGAAVALGPVLGGLLLENPQWFHWLIGNDWGSVFLINVPIVLVGAVGIVRLVPETRNPEPQRLDLPGLALSVTGLTLMVYGIIHAGDTKDWTAAAVLVPLLAGAAVVALFVVLEKRSSHRSFDVELFANRPYATSLTAVSLSFFAMSGVTFTLPFFLQVVRGYSTLQAGLCFLPFAVGQFLSAPRSAAMVARFGDRAVMCSGLALVVVALGAMSTLEAGTPLAFVLVVFFIFGLGMGNVIAPASTVMQNALPLARAGAGSAVQNTVRQVFGAFGIAIIGTVLATQYAHRLAPALDALPAQFPAAAKDAMSTSVAAAAGGLPAPAVATLRSDAFGAYIESMHVATWISFSLVVLALVVVATRLPRAVAATQAFAPRPGAE
jgi:EmrB/QacA subfamily drug resistance transporter